MKRALLLLVVIAGVALAEKQKVEEKKVEVEEKKVEVEGTEDAGRILGGLGLLAIAKKAFLAPVIALLELAIQIIITIALSLLIVTIKNSDPIKDLLAEKESSGSMSSGGYEYYHAPAVAPSSSGSSYASGYHKRSADNIPDSNPFMDLPVVQRLTERIHNAIENFNP